jgi:hypothetical protein
MLTSFKEIIIAFFIFCIILFFYLHIQFHFKTSNDLEIFEVDQASKDKMEEICDLRQPVLFDFPESDDGAKIINTTNKRVLLENYPVFEVKIRDSKDTSDSNMCVPLPLHVATKLFEEDTNASYFSEGNSDFLSETGAIKNMTYNDEYLRPYLVSNCYYDVLMGSTNVETPFRYDLNYRNYYIVTQGSMKVKLSPPKSSKYLYPVNDYENFEFKSQINPWEPQAKFRADFDKIKCLEIVLTPGRFLYIPAYWWYTFKFEAETSVSCFKYRTYMNNIAISPKIFMYALQNQNVERKIAKQIDLKYLKKQNEENNETTPIDQLTNNTNNTNNSNFVVDEQPYNQDIPDILIPKDEPEPLPQMEFKETLINNDNIETIFSENEEIKNENKERPVMSSSI